MEKLSILQFINVRWLNAEAGYGINLSKKLHQYGHKVFVCGVEGTPPVNLSKELGIPTFTDLKLHHNSPYYLYKDMITLKNFIQNENIQIINAHKSEGHFLGALVKKYFNNKIILIRTRGDVRLPKNYFFNRWLYNYTDKIITSALKMEQAYFTRLHVPEEKITTIYNAVDIDKFNPSNDGHEIREKYGIKNNEILIGIVGRLSPVKGHKYFIDAASIILKEKSKIKFIISGKESQVKFADLKSQANQLGILDKFIFCGVEKDVTKLFSAINIGIIASLGSETNCRVTQELMATERPVIGTSVGVIPEVLLNDKCGIIVPPGDANAIASAVIDLTKNPSKAQILAKNARRRMVEEFNEDIFVQKTEKIYYEALGTILSEV